MRLPILILAAMLAAPAFAETPTREGCYFGVCPDDAPNGASPSPSYETPPGKETEPPWRPPQMQPAFPTDPQAPEYSAVCTTLAGACFMDDFYPVGGGCWCPGLYGPVTGVVTPQ